MDIKQIMKWTVPLIALLAFQYAEGAESQPAGDVHLAGFNQAGDTANHLAYLTLMQILAVTQEESGLDANIGHVQEHLPFDQEKAASFVAFVLGSYDEMVATNQAISNRMLCAGKAPRYDANQSHAVLDVIDDIKETNLRKHYNQAMLLLGSRAATELEGWLTQIKTGTSPHEWDHQQLLVPEDVTVEQVVSTTCNRLALNNP